MDSLNLLQNGSLKSLAQMNDLLALEGRVRVDFGLKSVCVFVVFLVKNERGGVGYLYGGPKKEPLELWIPRTGSSGRPAGSSDRVGSQIQK